MLVAVLAGTLGFASAARAANSTPAGASTLAISSPIAVAATPNQLLALSSASCRTVYAISATGTVSTFATLSTSSNKCSEGAVAIAPGLGNFPAGEVYVLQNGMLFQIPASGSPSTSPVAPVLTISNLSGTYAGLTFDYTGSFGYSLLATGGKDGNAYAISPSNVAQFLGSFGTIVEGPSVAPASFGSYSGDLMVASESKSPIYAMSPSAPHSIRQFSQWPDSEAVSFVPGLACSYSTTGYAYFVADTSTNAIYAFPSSTFGVDAGSALLLGEFKGSGIGVADSSGTITSSLSISGTVEGAAYVACPVGIAQEVDLSKQGFDTANGSLLNLIGFDPASGQLVGADPTNAPSKVFLLNGATGAFVQNVSVGRDPSSVAYSPKTNALYVANAGSDNLTILNATTYAELGSISMPAGSGPVSAAYNGQNTKLYVANAGSDSVDIFSLSNNLFPNSNQIVTLNGTPAALVSDPADGNVYVVGSTPTGGGFIAMIHAFGNSEFVVVALPSAASAIALDSASGTFYVTVPGANEVALFAAGNIPLTTVTVSDPLGVAYNTENGLITVASGDGFESIIQGSTVITSFLMGHAPGPLVYDPVSNLVYSTADLTISSVDPRIIIGTTS